jgi:hypothetical protein
MDKPTYNIHTHKEHRPNQANCVIVERDTTFCACTGLSAKPSKDMGHGELRRQCWGVHVCTAHGSAFKRLQSLPAPNIMLYLSCTYMCAKPSLAHPVDTGGQACTTKNHTVHVCLCNHAPLQHALSATQYPCLRCLSPCMSRTGWQLASMVCPYPPHTASWHTNCQPRAAASTCTCTCKRVTPKRTIDTHRC